ncbi:hypothetical protein HYC85_000368 [Camellia sinensis]|uniref:Uncharacterized protein n=1 Tax=Camellia sinensis TaxID=4442 RepID=A0A7J7I2J3_CAMSI|nr:hypothetical protein HYC85_000368 [Camellia sinensis]
MTIYSAEFFPHCLAFSTQLLIKPTPYPHHNSLLSRTNPSPHDSITRNPPKVVKVCAETRPTLLQSHGCRETHLIKLLNRSCKSGKFNESLYFLECLVKNKGYKPDVILCTKLMQGFFNSKNFKKAIRVMEILESHGDPDVFAYNALINGFCKLNQIESANQVLNRMRDRGFSPDIITYNIMIGSLCSRGKLRLALKALDQLLDDNCEPTVITYTILIEATVLEGGINEAMKLFDEMLSKGLQPDMYTYNAIVRGLCREGMLDRAFAFVRSLPGKGFKPDVISYNMLLRAILTARKWNDGEKLVTEMCSIGCEPNVVTYSILISSFCREGKIDEAADVLKLMMEKGLSPDTYSYDPLISALCKEGKLDLAIEFIDCMISNGCLPDIVNYNTILSALCKNGNADLAMEIFEKLREIGSCPPDVSSYNTMFSALWNNGDRTQALRMVSEMIEKGIDPDEFTYNSLVSCLCRDGMVDEALELLEDMEGSGFQLTVITYNIVILGLCKAHRINDAIGKLAEMVEKGCRPNETTYVLLIEGIGFAGWRSEAMEMANSLFAMNAISKDSFKRLNKTFPMLDVYKDIVMGFIHPSQFVTLNEEAGGSLLSSVGTMLQSEDRVLGSRVSKVNPSETVFWCRDHKLGISTQVLLLLYNVAKQTFMAALERYKMHSNLSVKKDEYRSDNMSSWYASSLDVLESEVMKHSRKLVLSNKQHSQIFVDELLLSALVLSYAPKSECSWSHRRWVIKMIDGKSSNLQGIVEKESEIVKKIAEKSKMNYRAWNHRCWLVSHMSGGQRLMLRMLEESQHKQDPVSSSSYNAEFRQLWKEELDWNEVLIKQYIGREALWLHRRFLSFCWTKHFVTDIHDISSHSDHKDTMNHEIGVFMDTELELVCSCSTIPDNDYEDFQAQAMFSATYLLWLTKVRLTLEFSGEEVLEILVKGDSSENCRLVWSNKVTRRT